MLMISNSSKKQSTEKSIHVKWREIENETKYLCNMTGGYLHIQIQVQTKCTEPCMIFEVVWVGYALLSKMARHSKYFGSHWARFASYHFEMMLMHLTCSLVFAFTGDDDDDDGCILYVVANAICTYKQIAFMTFNL